MVYLNSGLPSDLTLRPGKSTYESQVKRPASSEASEGWAPQLMKWNFMRFHMKHYKMYCPSGGLCLHTDESSPPTPEKPNQSTEQQQQKMLERAKKKYVSRSAGLLAELCWSLHHHRVHVWSCKLNNFFNTGSTWMKLQKLLYVDKWGKKQRWWKGNQIKISL